MRKKMLFMALAAALLVPTMGAAQTDCDITLPWSENFDSYEATGNATLPDCWTRLVPFRSSSTSILPNLFSASGHGKVLNFMGQGASTSGTMKVCTPLIPAPLNALELSFDVYKNGLKVWLAADTADESTWVLVGTYSPGYAWETYEVRTDNIQGVGSEEGFIVFGGDFGSTYSNAYLDNLSVVNLNNCERPATVEVTNVTPETALALWPSVEGAAGYRVSYNTVDDITTALWDETTELSYPIGGLEPGTQYYVWVQALCGTDAMSDTRGTVFTTQQACYGVLNLRLTSLSSDMAAYGWDLDVRGHAATGVYTVLHDVTDPTVADVEAMSTGETYHYFAGLDRTHEYEVTFRTVCGEDTADAVTLPLIFPGCGESILASAAGDYSGIYPIATGTLTGSSMVLYEADVVYSMDTLRGIALHRFTGGNTGTETRTLSIYIGHTQLDSLTSNPGVGGLTQVAQNVVYQLAPQEWDTLLFTTPFAYDGHSNLLVGIVDNTGSEGGMAQWYWHSSESKMYYSYTGTYGSQSSSTYRQPDIRFVGQCNDEYTCEPPVLAVSEVDSVNATIEWMGGSSSSWTVQYRMRGTTTWIDAATDWTGSSYTFSDLEPSSHYEARVGVVCDEVTRYSASVEFSTLCALIYPPYHFTQSNMRAAYSGGFPECWHWANFARRYDNESGRAYVQNLGSTDIWFMLPPMADPVENVRFSALIATSTAARVKVGVAGTDNCSDVEWVDTLDIVAGGAHDNPQTYVSFITGYHEGNRIVVSPMVTGGYHYVFFYDFHIEAMDECMPAGAVVYDTADATSLSFHWTPRGDAQEWVVYVGGQAVATVDEPHYTATGLQPYTLYNVGVRSLCSEGDTSAIMSSATFRTGCEGDECYVTLVGHSEGDDLYNGGWWGSHLHVDADGARIEDFTLLEGSEKSVEMRVCAAMTISLTWLPGNAGPAMWFELMNADGDTLYSVVDCAALTSGLLFETDSLCTFEGGATPEIECVDKVDERSETVCDRYTWRGRTLTDDGSYSDTVAGAAIGGCDSIYVLHLMVNHSVRVEKDSTVSGPIVWNGQNCSASGTYTWRGTGANGCDSTVVLHLTVGGGSHEGIDAVDESGVTLMPNPAVKTVTIAGLEGAATVRIVDLSGREVYSHNAEGTSLTVDVEALPRGMYLVHVVTDDASVVRRLLVK